MFVLVRENELLMGGSPCITKAVPGIPWVTPIYINSEEDTAASRKRWLRPQLVMNLIG